MCTSIIIKSKDGHPFWGRTMDFIVPLFDSSEEKAAVPTKIVNIPANHIIKSELKDWKSQYAVMGVGPDEGSILFDGINERGITGDFQVLLETTHDSTENLEKRHLTPVFGEEFGTYVLTQCATLDDVKKLAQKTGLIDRDYVFHGKNGKLQLHYTFSDENGNSIVLEATNNGGFKIYDSVGVMTNSPEYSFHTTNLRNYISLDANNQKATKIGGKLPIEPIEGGTGYGMFGLPGDYTSPSRFVRATFITKNIDEFSDVEGISTLYNCFKPFIVPKGISHNPDTPGQSDSTQYWVGYDVINRTLYLQTPTCLTMTRTTLDPKATEMKKLDVDQTLKVNDPQ
ncbi:linear amide C-N hydrolase [Fructilactobacillus fructivorans]|uniref:linear amide C-N hydrolase n=1 Tax=Fructilactobacillus fructivorans TaxID=1614 RepID=UPI0007050132|nr:linear amide C-N hydrolase [Fructilactobacillus fructivorans]KRN43221.1 choloylglycine hydrolase [Fructilactobacillus fructivorans]